jgi:Cof subfamily protein (haloacid dehalogenase superfamily)
VPCLPIRLVALDLDGTLFNSRQQITPRVAAAVAAARDAGIEICIATGRRHTFAWRMLDSLHLPPDAVILSSNGAVARERGGVLLRRSHLSKAVSLELCRLMDGHRDAAVFTFDRVDEAPLASHHPGSLLMQSSEGLHNIFARWIDDNRPDILELPSLEDGLQHDLAIQAMVCGGIAAMHAFEERLLHGTLAGQLSIHRTEYPARDLCIVDIMPLGCSKGTALAWLASRRGISPSQVAAVGDNFNDEDMLQFAEHSFLLANAAAGLLAAAPANGWQIVPTNEEDGAAIALETIAEFNVELALSEPESERTATSAR